MPPSLSTPPKFLDIFYHHRKIKDTSLKKPVAVFAPAGTLDSHKAATAAHKNIQVGSNMFNAFLSPAIATDNRAPQHGRLWRRPALALLALCLCDGAGAQSAAHVGQTLADSSAHWELPPAPPAGAPNVLIVMLDDVGFGQAQSFGGPIATPTLQRLAESGLRYNTFHTTALCSPSRAALLTGRNHHSVGFGSVAEMASGFPGYSAVLPTSAATLPELLRSHGYSTAAFGKWHLLPDYETSPIGPFDRWPTGKGFEYFYGFLGGETNQWQPALYENTVAITPPTRPGYHFMSDMTDKAILWARTQHSLTPQRPFFMYFAPGATHSPHQAPRAWIDKYRGRFDNGWDQMRIEVFKRQQRLGIVPKNARLTPRPAGLPAWDSLSAAQKKVYARMMEVFAGYLEYADTEVGRLVDALHTLDEKNNTLIFYIVGDNGASGEGGVTGTVNTAYLYNGIPEDAKPETVDLDKLGGPASAENYPAAWAWAGDTPFPLVKTIASHLGGTRNGLVIDWPRGIRAHGEIRSQFHHIIDIAATVYEVAGIAPPTEFAGVRQQPLDGISMAYTFDDARAAGRRHTQYFEMFGNRALYHDGWLASAFHGITPWSLDSKHGYDQDNWELYDLRSDFSQANDLAQKYPAKLREMQALFQREAEKYQIYPLQEASSARLDPTLRPSLMGDRKKIIFTANMTRLPEGSAPNLKLFSHAITVDLNSEHTGNNGVLVAQGGRFGGFSLYLRGGYLYYTYNFLGEHRTTLHSPQPLPPGPVTVAVRVDYQGTGLNSTALVHLDVNQKPVAQGNIPRIIRGRFSLDETFDIGQDSGTAVADLYQAPFALTAAPDRVEITLQE